MRSDRSKEPTKTFGEFIFHPGRSRFHSSALLPCKQTLLEGRWAKINSSIALCKKKKITIQSNKTKSEVTSLSQVSLHISLNNKTKAWRVSARWTRLHRNSWAPSPVLKGLKGHAFTLYTSTQELSAKKKKKSVQVPFFHFRHTEETKSQVSYSRRNTARCHGLVRELTGESTALGFSWTTWMNDCLTATWNRLNLKTKSIKILDFLHLTCGPSE